MLYRLVVSGFNVFPKLLSRKEATREKEILRLSKRRQSGNRISLRTCSVHLLLAIIRHASTTTRDSLLGNRVVMSPFIRFMPLDSDSTLLEIIDTLEMHVLRDRRISRAVKSAFFGMEQCLLRIANLYRESPDETGANTLSERVRDFLLNGCLHPGNAICFEDRGWYPRLDISNHSSDVQLYNILLYRFIMQLRPMEDHFHRQLTLKALEVCPELRAPYLAKFQRTVDPSLTLSFVSALSLWAEILQLPLPRNLGDVTSLPDEPPPLETVSENVIPSFFNKSYLSSSLTHNIPLVSYLTSQLIFSVLSRLSELESRYLAGSSRWQTQWEEILERVARILPDPTVLAGLCSRGASKPLLRHSGVRILSLYTKLMPHRVTNFKLNFKLLLATFSSEWDLTNPLNLIDGLHLLNIINEQEDLDWWSRQGSTFQNCVLTLRVQAIVDWNTIKTACCDT